MIHEGPSNKLHVVWSGCWVFFPPELSSHASRARRRTDPLTINLITQLYTVRFHNLLGSRFKVVLLRVMVATRSGSGVQIQYWYKSRWRLTHMMCSSGSLTLRGASSTTFHFRSILQGILLFIGKHPDTSSYTMRRPWIINTLPYKIFTPRSSGVYSPADIHTEGNLCCLEELFLPRSSSAAAAAVPRSYSSDIKAAGKCIGKHAAAEAAAAAWLCVVLGLF